MADEHIHAGGSPAPPAGEPVHLPGPSLPPGGHRPGPHASPWSASCSHWFITGLGVVIALIAILRWVGDTRRDISELPLEH